MNIGTLFFIVLLFALLWLLFIQPQRRRQRAQRELLEDLAPGVEIITAGGFYGTVRSVDDDEVLVELAPGTEVRMAKRAVAAVIPPDVDEDEPEEELEELEEAEEEPVEVAVEREPQGEERS